MTIYTTRPTRPALIVDVPEPKNFNVTFFYNFFLKDESTSDVGVDVSQFESDIELLQDKLNRDVPRYTYLTWQRPFISSTEQQNQTQGQQFYFTNEIVLSELWETAVSEVDFSTSQFTALRFQDNTIDGKLFALVSGTITRDANLFNAGLQTAYNATLESISDVLKLSPNSLLDAAKLISSGDTSIDNLIVDALSDVAKLNADYIDNQEQTVMINTRFERVKSAKLDMQLNTKFAYTSLYDVVNDPVGTYTDEFLPIMSKVKSNQDQAIAAVDPTVIKIDDYEFYVEPSIVEDVSPALIKDFNTPRRLVGYIIDRYEIGDDGVRIKLEPIIVENINKTSIYDTRIKYGKRYCYEIRSVIAIQFLTIQNTQKPQLATLLIKSQPLTKTVETIERVPPPWPADFQISWDRKRKRPRLTWSYPVNSQRDVKKFQIFRRKSIDEPYQLIKEYNFDDSMVKYASGEMPDPTLVEKVEASPLHFIDDDFMIDSKYMYTMGCVDAHGLVSNFSSQIEIIFNPIKNSVRRNYVSGPNAPRPYPNMYVKQEDVIVDVMRDSRHSKMKLYFDPEYEEVSLVFNTGIVEEGSITQPANLLALSSLDSGSPEVDSTFQPRYKLQILNTDLQQTRTVDIIVDDKRTI